MTLVLERPWVSDDRAFGKGIEEMGPPIEQQTSLVRLAPEVVDGGWRNELARIGVPPTTHASALAGSLWAGRKEAAPEGSASDKA